MALADTQDTAGPWSDYAAPVAATSSDGPWSDYGAAKAAPVPKPSAPPIDYSHPAGLNGAAPQLPAHAPANLQYDTKGVYGIHAPNPDLNRGIAQAQSDEVQGAIDPARDAIKGAFRAGDLIREGTQDIGKSAAMDFEQSHGNPFAPNLQGDAAKQRTKLAMGGAAKLIAGGGTALLALDAPQLLDIGSAALAGDATAKLAMAKIAGSVAAGTGASVAGGAAADKLNLSPEAKSLVQSVAFFMPSLFGMAAGKAGFKGGIGLDAEGNVGAGVETPGGTKVAVRAGNGAVEGGIQRSGDAFPATVRVGRQAPPPDPARILDAQQADAGTNAVARAAQKAQQAAQVVQGGPPPPPPGPPLPDALKDGVISPATVQNIAQAIHAAPAEMHPQLLMEAHGKLTGYIEKQGRIIGPDGKLQIAETPQQAAKLAQNIINTEVDRQSQARADAAKQQADAVKQQQAEAEKPNADGVTPADQQFQRAKTIIDGTSPKPGQHLDETLMRNLNVDRPAAHALIDRYAKEKGSEQLPTVGSAKEPVIEESRATVDAQVKALQRGDTNVVMLPEGSRYRPAVPKGFTMMAVRGDAPGAGMYLYNPAKVGAATIREAAKAGTHGDLLGHVQPKSELDPSKPTVVVQAQAKDGTPIQDSEVHLERVAAQAASLQDRHPGATVVVKPAHQVIAERLAEGVGDDHPANDYANGAGNSERKEGRGESPEPAAAVSSDAAAAEKRTDLARRRAVSEMTPEEMQKELLTSRTVDLPNRRAFEEAEAKLPAKAVAMSDADGLKALNDKFGYEAGDGLLRAKAEALKEAGLEAYHDKGDEFLYRGESQAEIGKKLEAARAILRDREIDVKGKDGKVLTFKGADFSHGTGEDLHGAEAGLKEHKTDREARGERARGELRGIAEVGPEGRGVDHGEAAEEVAEPERKYKFGNVQHNIEDRSPAAKALAEARSKVAEADLAGDGKDVGENHVTVRYGLRRPATEELKAFLRSQPPFEASLGKVASFPPHADASEQEAAPLIASVKAPELHRINGEIDKHDDFEPSSYPEYKPHATIAYVKPDAVKKYVGDTTTEGKRFMVRSIAVGDRDGNHEEIELGGSKASSDVAKQEVKPAKGQRVAFKDRDGIEREGVINHTGERITRIGKYDVANAKVGEARPELRPGQDGRVAVSELHLDPQRFQYKVSGIGAEGVSDLLTGKRWNDKLSGAISAWRDPADGKIYVVNGHHRVTLAKQAKTPNLLVRLLDEPTAAAARATGALQNIADGRGSAIDAAKFFRDSGMTLETLEGEGISMGEATAQNGVALSRLDTRLFDMVVQGKMPQGRGIAIGRETSDAATQDAVLKLIEQAERRGQRVNDGTVEELARFAQTAPQRQETVASLFGDEERTENTALDKAMVSAYVKRQIGIEKRVFGEVSTEARAKTLSADGKNQIDAAGNAARATSAEQALEVYDKLSARRGPIDDILNRAAEERADAKSAEVSAIDQRAYEDIRAAVSETLAERDDVGTDGVQEAAGGGISRAELERAGQAGFFARRNPNHPVESLALPGMGGDIEQQSESAAATRAELQRGDVERSLATAKGDVSKAAGEMERHSPLFFGSEANEQGTLFHYDEDAFHNKLRATDAEFAENANFFVVEGSGNEAPSVHVNADAYQLLRKMPVFAQTGQWSGVSLDANSAFALRKQLRAFAARNEGQAEANALRLANTLKGDQHGNIILVHQGVPSTVVAEEQFHGFQRREGMAFGTRDEFKDMPGYDRAEAALKKQGYGLTPPDHLASEITAHIAAGFGDQLDLTREEQTGILKKFFDVAVAQNGPEVLERIPQMAAEWMYPKPTEAGDDHPSAIERRGKPNPKEGDGGRRSASENGATGDGIQEQRRAEPEKAGDPSGSGRDASRDTNLYSRGGRGRNEVAESPGYLHGGLGIAAGALKPLAEIKPVADISAFLGDEADRVAVSRDLHNRLYDLASQDNAAMLRVVQMLKAMPGTAKDQQAIYHHLEDPKAHPLNDAQQEILDGYLTPLIYQAEHDFQVITEGGVPLENYVHRQVRDRGGMIDRLLEKAKEKTPGSGIGGGRLTKTAPGQKHRTMMAVEEVKTGKRQVVSIKGGRVAVMENGKAPEDIGGLRSGLTTVGAEVDERMMPFVKRVTELRDEIAGAKDADRDEQLADVQGRIAELEKQRSTLEGVKVRVGTEMRVRPRAERVAELNQLLDQQGDLKTRIAEAVKQQKLVESVKQKVGAREPDLFDKSAAAYSNEVTFRQRAAISKRLHELRGQFESLGEEITTAKSDIDKMPRDPVGSPIYSNEVTFGKRAALSEKLEPLLKKEEALKAGTAPMLVKNTGKLNRRREDLKDAEAARDHFLDELPPETFADKAWKSKDGGLYKITQATTKEIEANTNVRYYQNAAGSVAVNYLAMDKARRAYEFLEEFKRSPEFAAASHSLNSPGAIPKGWQATQLPQFRGYFFEPHVAEVLDAYAAKAAHDPSVLEKVGNFLRASIFFNPLIHIPNLLNHWAVEKGVSGFANPLNYPSMTRAGMKAINAVIHQNKDFLDALDHGAPLQSQQFETKQFADLFFKRMQDELGDPESSQAKELAEAVGMSPVRLVKAIYDFSGKATWYTNDIAFLQAAYEKQERGMSLKDALTETAKHIPDYRLMTRIFDNPKLAKLMSNRNLTMFGAYHYGALKSYGQMAKSLAGFNWTDAGTKNDQGEPTNSAGRTEDQEKRHGLDALAMVALVTFVVYPLIDKLFKMATGNDKAQVRRAGASTLIYNLAMMAKGEKTPEELAESVATPAVQTKALAELALNRDMRTGQRLYDPHASAGKLASQVGRQVMRSVAPVSQGMDLAEGRTDWKRLAYSMIGVSFPLHGAEKIAAQITAERLSSLPPRDEDQIAHAIERSRALHDFWSGNRTKLDALLHSKEFTAKEKAKIRKDALLPPIVYAVKGMEYDDAVKVYHAANAEQKRELRPLLNKKLATLVKEGKKPQTILGKDDDN